MDMLITAVNLIAVLGALVIAHEFGHFIVAKWCGMRVDDFSLFFGPRLLRVGKFHGTEYNIRSIPLGGFVKIAGMEPDDLILGAALLRPSGAHGRPVALLGLSEDELASLKEEQIGDRVRSIAETAVADDTEKRLSPGGREELKSLLESKGINEEEHRYIETLLKADAYVPDPRGYNQKPIWKRAATIAAGPFMSLLFSFVVVIVMGFTTGIPYASRAENSIGNIRLPNGPAARAGLRRGDRVVAINGVTINDGEQMVGIIHDNAGKPLNMQVQRGSKTIAVTVVPEPGVVDVFKDGKAVKQQVGLIGVEPNFVMLFRHYTPVAAVRRGSELFAAQITGTVRVLFSRDVAKNTGGIIRIGDQIREDSKAGLRNVLFTAAMLSLSLGIMNLLPIPVLDGGHLLLLAWEGIRRRKLTSREVLTAQLFGFSVIAVLFILVTYKDFIQVILPNFRHG